MLIDPLLCKVSYRESESSLDSFSVSQATEAIF
jgi:hypothetical protein